MSNNKPKGKTNAESYTMQRFIMAAISFKKSPIPCKPKMIHHHIVHKENMSINIALSFSKKKKKKRIYVFVSFIIITIISSNIIHEPLVGVRRNYVPTTNRKRKP